MDAAGGPARLRGWGGVGAMAVLCALALTFVLMLPRTQAHPAPGPVTSVGPVVEGSQARASACEDATAQDRSLPPSGASGKTIDAIKARPGTRKLVVGVDQNSYRWGYRNPNNPGAELEGFDIDLVHRIAADIVGDPDAVQFRAIPTSQRIAALREGRVDMVVRTMTISCERLKDVAFSAPYFRTGQQVLAPKSSPVKGYQDLAGRRVCTAAGSTARKKLELDVKSGAVKAVVAEAVPNQLDCLVRLQLGEADAVITDGALAASQAAQDPTLELKGPAFTTEYYGVAMAKDAKDLVGRVNRVLADYRSDGWQASYDKWLSATLGKDAKPYRPPVPEYRGES
ncbi:glutamate ABC transporter substrate-binding protein [Streptomyces sp. SID4985]|uniref:glutamate ABC transporter substrate-binding protein n=1 Tax=unclassified Streptomyces TaxID=2593676 RepID=UPI00136C0AF2|nr:glutamate ABC transporter substrate-binding protein [Streptomyces sp. SID4985]MYQ46365.1 transporter substrate-binding domain-containing protein [Streptomyces sp. SID4985]